MNCDSSLAWSLDLFPQTQACFPMQTQREEEGILC